MLFNSKKLLKLMNERNETFRKASERMGLSHSGLWNVAKCKSAPNIKTLRKIAEAYDVGVSFFID